MTFQTLDSGQRQQFSTGSVRDTQDEKPRYLSIPLNDLEALRGQFDLTGQPLRISRNGIISGTPPPDQVRLDLLPMYSLARLAALFGRGAFKYGDNNWQKGQPISRYYDSMYRHMLSGFYGSTAEDEMAGVMWNACAVMWTEEQIIRGNLPFELADAGQLKWNPR